MKQKMDRINYTRNEKNKQSDRSLTFRERSFHTTVIVEESVTLPQPCKLVSHDSPGDDTGVGCEAGVSGCIEDIGGRCKVKQVCDVRQVCQGASRV